ncbi:MAG TPA: MFS transporter [Verrucomicrobiae bacterium]|nr:MFS transporter [Verrucomicrobiae bacterium]
MTTPPRALSPAWLLGILTGLNLFNYLDRYVVSAVLTPLQTEFKVSDGDVAELNTIFMIGYFVTSPVFGFLGDRFSRKWLIAIGIFVWSLGTVLTGFATSFAELLGYRILVGVGEASYATISPSLISDAYPPARRNDALTIFYVAIPVGAALGNILGGVMADHYGWRSAFIWAGAPGLLLAVVLLPFSEPERGQAEHKTTAKPRLGDVTGLFRSPNYCLVVAGYTAYTFALGAFGIWGPTFLHRVHGVSVKASGTFFGSVLVVAGLLGTLLGGLTASAWQRRNRAGYASVLCLSVLTAAPMAVLSFWTTNKAISMSCLALAMFFIFLCTGPVNTLILESVPVNLRASAMAVSIFAIHLFGDIWSPKIVGRLSDHWGSLQTAVLILPGALAAAAVFWFALILRMRGRPSAPA